MTLVPFNDKKTLTTAEKRKDLGCFDTKQNTLSYLRM